MRFGGKSPFHKNWSCFLGGQAPWLPLKLFTESPCSHGTFLFCPISIFQWNCLVAQWSYMCWGMSEELGVRGCVKEAEQNLCVVLADLILVSLTITAVLSSRSSPTKALAGWQPAMSAWQAREQSSGVSATFAIESVQVSWDWWGLGPINAMDLGLSWELLGHASPLVLT